jgi:uncharacterized phage protein (TIGR02220 family)
MFNKQITESDSFLNLSATSQNLYFHLNMNADDEVFVNSPKRIMRAVGASEGDLRLLIQNRFIIPFESGIVVIKHWYIHNYIRGDRIKETVYINEKSLLSLKDNKIYTENVGQLSGSCQADDGVDKNSIDKIRLDKNSIDENHKNIIDYLNEKADTKYRYSGRKTRELINARLNEGFKQEDFKVVIDKIVYSMADGTKKEYSFVD